MKKNLSQEGNWKRQREKDSKAVSSNQGYEGIKHRQLEEERSREHQKNSSKYFL